MRVVVFLIVILIYTFGLFSSSVLAQDESLTISITPPLIKNNVNPGQIWQSAIKLVNNNDKRIEVYVQVVDFTGGSEDGTVNFITKQVDSESDIYASNWLQIQTEGISIEPQQSKEIPFTVIVPETADPGGHYVAILAGTQPPADSLGGTGIKISSLLASLLLLNVAGEVQDQGDIREFSTDKKYYTDFNVKFNVRFENQGNVHIQPQGEIRIYNFRDVLQDSISINHQSDYGNVLPKSIRQWEFDWQGGSGLLDMGRYRAELILGFGIEVRQTVDRTLYFWLINLKVLSFTLGSILLAVVLIVFFIRLYIRRAIAVTQKEAGLVIPKEGGGQKNITVIPEEKTVVDLNTVVRQKTELKKFGERQAPNYRRLKRTLWLLLILFIIAGTALGYYLAKDNLPTQDIPAEIAIPTKTNQEDEQISEKEPAIENFDNEITEEKTGKTETARDTKAGTSTKSLIIKILNGSGISGQAAKVAEILEAEQFSVDSTGNADSFNYQKSQIFYRSEVAKPAQIITELLGSIASEINDDQEEDIVIIVGSDFE